MPTRKKITPEEAVADLKGRKHGVSKGSAVSMIKKFKSQNGKVAKAAKSIDVSTETSIVFPAFLSYNKKAINKILGKKDCIGLRIYPALTAENEFTLVIVGIDESNNNMVATEDAMPAESKTVKKKSASIVAKPVTGLNDDILDEGQASPPYPPPPNGGL
jgi:hypothetical protein